MACKIPPPGWLCTREEGHDGPCAALPDKFTHKGWFGICPVYLGDLDREPVQIAPRWWAVVPLFVISEWWQGATIYVCSWLNPDYVPVFKLKITGELK